LKRREKAKDKEIVMFDRIRVTLSMIVIAGGLMIVSAGMTDAQGSVENALLVACSGSCCSGSPGHEMSHQGASQHGSSQGGVSPSGAVQGQAAIAEPTGGTQPDARLASQRQELCPVLGDKVDRSVYMDHEGRRVYFCCSACIARFTEAPARYMKEMEAKGISLERTPGR
jgi:YHS domain-containing protein